MTQIAAYVAAVIFALLALFQLALALGAPLGDMAWGGRQPKRLPGKFRLASLISAPVLLFFAAIVLEEGGVIVTGLSDGLRAVVIWVIVAFLALNTLGNFASTSRKEMLIMGPAALIAFVATLIVAI
jgi:hypothetical protein